MDQLEAVRRRAAAAAQVFVDHPADPQLAPDDAHHLARVLRLRDGEQVIAADGRGRWAECRYAAGPASPVGPHLEPLGPSEFDPAPKLLLTVAFAPVKGDRPEWVVQKLTELGIDRVVPLVAERSVVVWKGERAVHMVERLAMVAREAAAQSRRTWLPELAEITTPAALSAGWRSDGPALALAQLGGTSPHHWAGRIGRAGTGDELAAVAVGPEGGWSDDELALGLPHVGLGTQVLRAETAAVAAGVLLGAQRASTVAPSL